VDTQFVTTASSRRLLSGWSGSARSCERTLAIAKSRDVKAATQEDGRQNIGDMIIGGEGGRWFGRRDAPHYEFGS